MADAKPAHDQIVSGANFVKTTLPTGGKPSVARGALGGATSGAAAGAALGSAVPVVGTAVGAAGGAALGGAGGAARAHGQKKAARAAQRAALGPARQLLVVEFLICMVILALSPLTDKHKTEGPQAFLRRGTAVCVLFFILALLSAGGRGPTKVAAGFGGIVTVTLLVSSRDVFAVLAAKFNSTKEGPAGPDATGEQLGADLGSVAGGTAVGAGAGGIAANGAPAAGVAEAAQQLARLLGGG